MLNRDMSFLDEDHICPHCNKQMLCCEAPPIHIGDGLGWGSDILYICLHDECSLFLKGWNQIEQQYGHHASYRYMELPGSKEGNLMMVGNVDAFKASVVDPNVLRAQNERFQDEKKAIEGLDTCVDESNIEPVLALILDEAASLSYRKKAIDLLPVLNNLDCIDPIRNHTFRDSSLEMKCNQLIQGILKSHFKKECPHCSEIVKMQAKKCMFCKEEL